MSEGTDSQTTLANESEVFASVKETQNEIQSQKLEHIRKWVHTQALNIPQSKLSVESSSFSKPSDGDADDDSSEKQENSVPLRRHQESKLPSIRNQASSPTEANHPAESSSHSNEDDQRERAKTEQSLLSESSEKEVEDHGYPGEAASSGSFDFGQFSGSQSSSNERHTEKGPSSTSSFLSAFGTEQKETLKSETVTSLGPNSLPSHTASYTESVLQDLNKKLTDLGFGSIECKPNEELLRKLVGKLRAILSDVDQKRASFKALMSDSGTWKSKEQVLNSKIKSLELQLDEKEKAKQLDSSKIFARNEEYERTIKRLQDAQQRLSKENKKLKNDENILRRKLNESTHLLETTKSKVETTEKEKGELKTKVRTLNDAARNLERQCDDAQKQLKPLENSNRVKDSELCQLRMRHEASLTEQEQLAKKCEWFENAFKDQERESLRLKHLIESGAKSQEAKQALKKAFDEIKALKEELSMERSKRNSIEMKNEKLVQDLKRAQQTNSSLEKSVKNKENKILDLEIEAKRLKADHSLSTLQQDLNKTCDPSTKDSTTKEKLEKLGKEKKDAVQEAEEVQQKCKFLQKENLELMNQRIEAEKTIQKLKSESTRSSDDLQEMACDLKDTKERLRSMERSLSSSESQNLSNSASLKAQRMDRKSIQKENSELNSFKIALEHKVHHLENSNAKLKEALKNKIEHEERRDLNEKHAFHKLQEKASIHSLGDSRRSISRSEVFHFAERRLGELEEEVESLKTEQRRLLTERKAMENQMTESKCSETSRTLPSNKIHNRLRLAEKSITDLSTKLVLSQEKAAKDLSCFTAEKQNLERRINEHKNTIQDLQRQLDQRPTVLSSAEHHINSLEKQLTQRGLPGTENHSIGKGPVGKIPRPLMEKILKNLCLMLETHDPHQLTDNVSKLIRVVSSLPKVQRFVSEVCEIVLSQGKALIPSVLLNTSGNDVSVLVPSVLKFWLKEYLIGR